MSIDMFLKLDGIKGESRDAKHKEEIDIDGFSFGVSQIGLGGRSGGSGAGKAEFSDVTIHKRSDKASPVLMMNCATGEHIKEGLITVRKAGGGKQGGQEYYKIKLTDILISSFQNSGDAQSDVPMETISLNFATVTFSYQPQNDDGTLGGAVSGGYDVRQNKSM
jgi:type VI secretion system secreted protein Hcp